MNAPTPPMLPGLPLLGNALDLRRDPLGLFRRGYERHGPVFGVRLARQPAAVLVGPDATRFFFEATGKALSMSEVYQFLTPIVGGKVLFTATREEYDEQRRIMLPAFHGRRLRGYVGEMAAEAGAWLDGLGDAGEFELHEVTERLTMAIAARSVFGPRFRERLGPELPGLFADLSGGLEFVLPTNLPLPRFLRRDRALRRLQRLFGEVVAERRRNPGAYDDFLQVLVEASYLGHERIPDDKLVTILVGLLFGGRENTAGHLAWCLVLLLQHPDFLARVTEESLAALGEGAPDFDTLKGLPVLDRCLQETDRLRPMTVMLVRYTAEDYELGGYRVPKGWVTVAALAQTHRLPQHFADPDRYDPDRFAPGRGEVAPFSIANFGGALHKCWATAFVNHEVKVILSMLLRRYELALADPAHPTEINDIGVWRPRRPCRVRYRRRAVARA